MSRNDVNNSQDVIDSRSVIDRIKDLESDKEDLQSAIDEAKQAVADFVPLEDPEENEQALEDLNVALQDANNALDDWVDASELAALLALQEECEGYSDWTYGETLIRESYWETYVQEFAEDIGAIKTDAGWPYTCIDWERAAKELAYDYTTVTFDGVDYYIRSS